MSALLFHSNIEFDFAKKPQKSTHNKKLLSVLFLLGIFIVSVFGISKTKYQTANSNLEKNELVSQYLSSAQSPSLSKLIKTPEFTNSYGALPASPMANYSTQVPILMYHYTPEDFEVQLLHLQDNGYHTITMNELAHYLYIGVSLPTKPVVLTFDDGFADQQKAFDLLKKYNMKATLYLILGGAESNYCIGISRTNINCGDNYLSWSQIKQMSDSNLIEIGAHTINHVDLANISPERQWQEISESKKRLEDIYNITVTTFAYPYGKHNQTSIDSVNKAGFLTAVTTQPGIDQSSETRFVMPRVRNALLLP